MLLRSRAIALNSSFTPPPSSVGKSITTSSYRARVPSAVSKTPIALAASTAASSARLTSPSHSSPLPLTYPFTLFARRTMSTRTHHDLPPDTVEQQTGWGMTISAKETEDYLRAKVGSAPTWGADPVLERAQKRADDAGMPRISVSPLQGQTLTILAKSMKAEKILEIGTLAGYSTIFLAKALPSHGQIDTLEYSPLHARIANENFLDADLFPFPKVHVGPAYDTLRDPKGAFAQPPGTVEGLAEEERGYDLIFIDANKEQYFEYFVEALRLARKGGLIILDNAVRGGRIAAKENPDASIDVTGLRKVYDWVEKDAGKTVLMSVTQTVGDKFWDGFALAYKL